MKYNNPITDENVITYYVVGSDDDLPIVQEVYVGLNMKGELIVSIENTDYEEPEYGCSTWAVVSDGDSRRLSRRLEVPLQTLPRFIGECMAEWREIINPTFRDVQDCFKEITERLLDEGCRFRIRRTCGPRGFICC